MLKYFLLFFGYCICVGLWKKEISQPKQKIYNTQKTEQFTQQPIYTKYESPTYQPKQKRVDVEIELKDDRNKNEYSYYQSQFPAQTSQVQQYQTPPIYKEPEPVKISLDKAVTGDYVGNPSRQWREISLDDRHCHHGVFWYISQKLVDPDGYLVIRTKSFPHDYSRSQVVADWNQVHGHKPLGMLKG